MRKLKLFFACLLMAVLSIGQVWAEDIEITVSNLVGWNSTQGTQSGSYGGITISSDNAANNTQLRFYSGGTHTFTSSVGNITKVVFTCTANGTSNYGPGKMSGDGYTASSGKTGTWEGDATSFTLTGGQARVTSIVVTYTPAAPADPYTVTLMDDTEHPITETSAGAGVTLPSRDGCTGYTFAGWTKDWTAAQTEWTTTAPTIIPAGNYAPTADENLYPVYTKTEEGGSSSWEKLTSNPQVGDVVLLVNETNTVEAKDKTQAKYITVETYSGTPAGLLPWTLEVGSSEGTFSFKNGDVYLNLPSASNELRQSTDKTDNSSWTISVAEGGTATITNVALTARIIKYNSGSPRFACYESGQQVIQLYKQTTSSTTSYISEPSCCTKRAISIATGITNGSISADLAEACEGVTVTITFSPAGGYHLESWSVNGTAQNVNANTFLMPAAAATVSATFAHDDCVNLAKPTLDGVTKTYNSATIAWNTVTDAVAYAVSVVKDGESEPVFSGNVDALSKALADLEPETKYNYTIMAIGDGTVKCAEGNPALEGNFTTEALPTAHLTLMNLGAEHASSGDYAILTPFNLPTTAAACSKVFVGWDADPDCATAPTYVKGAEFTFANTTGVTLYAVYADAEAGDISYTKLTSDAFDAEATYIIAAAQTTSDATMWYLNSCANTDQNNGYGFMTTDPENNAPIQFQLSGTASALKIREVSGAKRYLKGLTTGNFQMSASEQTLTLSNAGAIGSSSNYILRHNYNSGNGGLRWYSSNTGTIAYLYKVEQEFTYSNYATTCVEAPEAIVDPEEVNAPAAGVANGVIEATYDNVNESAVAVALYSNAACTEAFTGTWLSVDLDNDKNITYTIAENTSYNDARTAYIKLTAPETTAATDPAIVVIPVTQAKKAAVFSSLEELVAADLNNPTNVTVSFSNVVIEDIYYYNEKRSGVVFNIQKADQDIKIYFNNQTTIADWVAGGTVSGTLTDCPWKIYSGAWQLAPASGWAWSNLTYTAPKEVSTVVITGAPSKTTYVDGEKFNPAGLTVTVNYNDATSEVNPTGVTFACTPERVTKETTSVSVVATFNEVPSDAFAVTSFTVGDIQLKTVAQFIEAGNADMRCYLEGIVSDIETGAKLKYGNFNLTDASGTIYVYGCLDQNGVAEQFESLGVNNGDKIKVIAEDYEYYNSKHEAKNVQFVSKTPAATIAIDDIAMETGDELALSSIVATITPAAAQSATITYNVTAGTAVTISEDKIIANAEGVATITASIAEGVGYLAANTTFTVTVTAPDTRKKATASAFTALSGDMSSTDISFAAYQGDGTNPPVVRSGDNPVTIRLYKPDTNNNKNTGNYLTLTAKVGCTIDQVKIEFSGNADAAYCKDAEALPTSKYIEGESELLTPTGLNAQSVSIVNLKSGSIDVATITVWYNGAPMSVDHYILGGTYPTEFEQHGTFSYEGLTVTAAYDAEETITEPVSGFTVEADLTTAGDKKAYVYLDDAEIAQYDITVTPTAKLNPEIGWSPADNIVMTEGDEFTAPTWQNPHSVSVSFESTNTNVATVSNAGVITIKGLGSTTISATFDGDETYYSANPSITVTVNAAVEDLMGNWVVASSVAAGDRIIIANVAEGTAVKTMGAQNGNFRDEVASTVSNNIMTPAEGTKVFTLIDASTIDANYNGFALRATNGKYLSAASSSSNNIKEVASVDDANAVWSIVISEGKAAIVAQGSFTRKVIRYNSSQPRFSCYAVSNDMKDVVIYKRAFDYEREIAQGVLSTTCLPNGGVIYGASIFEVAYMDYEADGITPHKIYFDEVEGGIMEAGVPYIVLANEGSDKFGVYYSDNENKAAQSKNGLVGYIGDGKYLAENDYFIYNNMFYYVSAADANTRVHISNNRAYINLSDVPGYNNEPISVPAPRRRVSLGNGAPKVATGIDEITNEQSQMTNKVIIDGRLFIIRGEKMYNANGQLVK